MKPWRWPIEWFHDEKWWREVAARMTSILLAAVVIAVGGVMTGLIDVPLIRGLVAIAMFIVLCLAVAFSPMLIVSRQYKKFRKEHGPDEFGFVPVFKWYYVVPGLIVAFFVMLLIQEGLQYWGGWN